MQEMRQKIFNNGKKSPESFVFSVKNSPQRRLQRNSRNDLIVPPWSVCTPGRHESVLSCTLLNYRALGTSLMGLLAHRTSTALGKPERLVILLETETSTKFRGKQKTMLLKLRKKLLFILCWAVHHTSKYNGMWEHFRAIQAEHFTSWALFPKKLLEAIYCFKNKSMN